MSLIIKEAEAMKFVEKLHRPQTYGTYPYWFHLYQVVSIAKEFGFGEDEVVVLSCWLHDVLEDTHVSYNDVKTESSREVADVVYNVTDELGKNRKERHLKTYPKIATCRKSLIVKLCDRIANVRFGVETGEDGKKEMYRKEYAGFKSFLYFEDEDINPMWVELDRLILG